MEYFVNSLEKTKSLKPLLKWAGGKSSLVSQIIPFFPPQYNRYIEPFMGSGSVFLTLQPSVAILNDLNSQLISFYEVVRDQPLQLIETINNFALNYSEKYYYLLRANSFSNPIEQAARFLFLNKTCFNGLYRENKKGFFNVPFGKKLTCPSFLNKENLLSVSNILKGAQLSQHDFIGVINSAKKDDLVYCDPPYLPLTITSNFSNYLSHGFTLKDHERLRDACVSAAEKGAHVFISNSISEECYKLYKTHTISEIKAIRRISAKKEGRGELKEILVKITT